MYVISRNLKKGRKDFNIYDKSESKDNRIDYKYWKDCDADDYGISDDGYIGKCLSRKDYKSSTLVTMCYGVNWVNKSSKIFFLKNYGMGIYCMTNPKHWVEAELNKKRFKDTISAYVAQLTSSGKVDWNVLGNIYRPDQEIPAMTVKKLFKEEKVKSMVKDELKKVLTDKGINEDFVLDTILDAIEIAKVKQDPSNMLKASSELSDYLQMKPEKRVQTEKLQIDVSKQISNTIEEESKRLVAEKEVEISD
tara:strand:+ start:2358 stop:3107 length:750 start_codon:yes stop_codon:yes gene_type:complete